MIERILQECEQMLDQVPSRDKDYARKLINHARKKGTIEAALDCGVEIQDLIEAPRLQQRLEW